MLFFAVTKPKKKIFLVAKICLLVLLLGVAVPSIYYGLADVGAMKNYQQEDGMMARSEQETSANLSEIDLYVAWEQNESTQMAAIEQETAPGEPIRVMQEVEQQNEEATDTKTTDIKPEKNGIIAKLKAIIFGEPLQIEYYEQINENGGQEKE